MSKFSDQILNTTQKMRAQESRAIDTAIILGSGLGDIAPSLDNICEFDYQNILDLPAPSVMSHHGKLTIGDLNNQCIAICQGRHHLYEGYSAQQVATMVYLLGQLGTKRIIVTNAAGALNPTFRPSDVMIIKDHINFTGQNPIVGQEDDLGNRFTDMSQAYNSDLIALAEQAAQNNNLTSHEGIYAGVLGPSLETSAERKMLAKFGADAVGMSTIMEVIAANQCGMQVLGLSAITNMALGDDQQKEDTIEDVLHYAEIAGKGIKEIINSVLSSF